MLSLPLLLEELLQSAQIDILVELPKPLFLVQSALRISSVHNVRPQICLENCPVYPVPPLPQMLPHKAQPQRVPYKHRRSH